LGGERGVSKKIGSSTKSIWEGGTNRAPPWGGPLTEMERGWLFGVTNAGPIIRACPGRMQKKKSYKSTTPNKEIEG